ncbi:hypothetical protein D3C87_1658490 [compost metagenome]
MPRCLGQHVHYTVGIVGFERADGLLLVRASLCHNEQLDTGLGVLAEGITHGCSPILRIDLCQVQSHVR